MDFKRAVALQANPIQVIQFQRLTKSTWAARKGAQDLLQLAEDASKPDLFHSTKPLTSEVEEAQTDNEKFLLHGRAGTSLSSFWIMVSNQRTVCETFHTTD